MLQFCRHLAQHTSLLVTKTYHYFWSQSNVYPYFWEAKNKAGYQLMSWLIKINGIEIPEGEHPIWYYTLGPLTQEARKSGIARRDLYLVNTQLKVLTFKIPIKIRAYSLMSVYPQDYIDEHTTQDRSFYNFCKAPFREGFVPTSMITGIPNFASRHFDRMSIQEKGLLRKFLGLNHQRLWQVCEYFCQRLKDDYDSNFSLANNITLLTLKIIAYSGFGIKHLPMSLIGQIAYFEELWQKPENFSGAGFNALKHQFKTLSKQMHFQAGRSIQDQWKSVLENCPLHQKAPQLKQWLKQTGIICNEVIQDAQIMDNQKVIKKLRPIRKKIKWALKFSNRELKSLTQDILKDARQVPIEWILDFSSRLPPLEGGFIDLFFKFHKHRTHISKPEDLNIAAFLAIFGNLPKAIVYMVCHVVSSNQISNKIKGFHEEFKQTPCPKDEYTHVLNHPYLFRVYFEILRQAFIAPVLPRLNTRPIHTLGPLGHAHPINDAHEIPSRSLGVSALRDYNLNPRKFKNPDQFDPDRSEYKFSVRNGKIKTNGQKPMVFSHPASGRKCPGEGITEKICLSLLWLLPKTMTLKLTSKEKEALNQPIPSHCHHRPLEPGGHHFTIYGQVNFKGREPKKPYPQKGKPQRFSQIHH